jgi:hypothetical protein
MTLLDLQAAVVDIAAVDIAAVDIAAVAMATANRPSSGTFVLHAGAAKARMAPIASKRRVLER